MTIKEELKDKTLVEILDMIHEKSEQHQLKKNRRWVSAAMNYLQKRYYPAEVPLTKKDYDQMMTDRLNGVVAKPQPFNWKNITTKSQEEIDRIIEKHLNKHEPETQDVEIVSSEIWNNEEQATNN